MKILVVSHHSGSLVNFRRELLNKMIELGHEVIAIAPDNSVKDELRKMNIKLEVAPVDKQGLSIVGNMKYLFNIIKCIRKHKVDLVFSYTVKPIVFGAIASLFTRCNRFYTMVEGLGGVFTEPISKKKLVLQYIIKKLYWISFKISKKVFLLNTDDLNYLTKRRILEKGKAVIIPGIGVDLDRYKKVSLPNEPSFLIIARLIYSKGVIDFCEAAEIVKKSHPEVKFNVLGGYDNKDDAIPQSKIEYYVGRKIISYLGETKDVRPFIQKSLVFVLPSYYREGLPRTIVEAMAMGRPIITTDNVGCRDTVTDGVNGYIIPIQDSNVLAEKMKVMIENYELCKNMAMKSHDICRQRYDVNNINNIVISEMNL